MLFFEGDIEVLLKHCPYNRLVQGRVCGAGFWWLALLEGWALTRKRLLIIFLSAALGAALWFSWYLPENHGFWFNIDKSVFFFFNDLLPVSRVFLVLDALLNERVFDAVSFLAMALLFYWYWRKYGAAERARLFCMGVLMLLCAVAIKQISLAFCPVTRASPTIFFDKVNLITELLDWDIAPKVKSSSSFPGDHGMMLMIFCCFMGRYFGRGAFLKAAALAFLFAMPRVMGGAHWFTDIAIGSLSVVLIVMPAILLTPFSDRAIDFLMRFVPRRFYEKPTAQEIAP